MTLVIGDVGFEFICELNVDITGYSKVLIYFISPSGAITSATPDTVYEPTGVLKYKTKLQSEINVPGVWIVQPVLWRGAGNPQTCTPVTITAYASKSNPGGGPI